MYGRFLFDRGLFQGSCRFRGRPRAAGSSRTRLRPAPRNTLKVGGFAPEAERRWPAYALAAAAVTATAVTGARGVDPTSNWYKALAKPPWQPPPWAFGAVWTPLYGTIAFAAGHAANRGGGSERRRLVGALAVNLALNASWNWLFFAARSPRAALVDTTLLTLSTLDVMRVTARVDRTATKALTPYAAWCAFATALNADIVRRNGGCR